MRLASTSTLLLMFPVGASAQDQLTFDEVHTQIPTWPNATTRYSAAAAGDVDQDGNLDLLLGTENGVNPDCPGLSFLWLGDGRGGYLAAEFPETNDDTRALLLADFNGDEAPDAFFGNSVGVNRYFINDGWGHFEEQSIPAISLAPTWDVAACDADSDGDLDVFLARTQAENVQLENVGGSFAIKPGSLPADTQNSKVVVAADWNGDGAIDLFFANDFGLDRLYRNDGTGMFADTTHLLGAWDEPPFAYDAAFLDPDQDGDLDLLICRGTGNILYMRNDPGGFVKASNTVFPTDGSMLGIKTARSLKVADFTNDGIADILLAEAGSSSGLLIGDSSGEFSVGLSGLLSAGVRPDLAEDLDEDGDVDVLSVDERAFLYLGDGKGSLALPSNDFAGLHPNQQSKFSDLFDVDLDGDLDLLQLSGFLIPLLNSGVGTFSPAPSGSAGSSSGNHIYALGDLNSDGYTDMVGTFPGSSRLTIYTNVNGTYEVLAAPLQLPEAVTAAAIYDADGDDDLDILVAWGETLSFFANRGTGDFSNPPLISSVSSPVESIQPGDFYGVGVQGLLVRSPERVVVMVGNGAGLYATWETLDLGPEVPGDPFDIEVGDIDGDGDLDAVVPRFGPNLLLINNGNAHFSIEDVFTEYANTNDVTLADLDGDGDLDLFVSNLTVCVKERSSIYLNDGTGTFASLDAPALNALAAVEQLIVGDIDGDGDQDIVAEAANSNSNRNQTALLRNLQHQLAWRHAPKAGASLTLDLWGPAQGQWIMLVSGMPGSLSTRFGTLGLDLDTALVLANGQLDAAGRDSLALDVPDSPTLLGESLYWQAVFNLDTEPRLSNAEVTTFGAY